MIRFVPYALLLCTMACSQTTEKPVYLRSDAKTEDRVTDLLEANDSRRKKQVSSINWPAI